MSKDGMDVSTSNSGNGGGQQGSAGKQWAFLGLWMTLACANALPGHRPTPVFSFRPASTTVRPGLRSWAYVPQSSFLGRWLSLCICVYAVGRERSGDLRGPQLSGRRATTRSQSVEDEDGDHVELDPSASLASLAGEPARLCQ